MKPGEVGEIRTEEDLRRAARRLLERGVTDPEDLVDQLLQRRSSAELKIMFGVIWASLSPAGRERVLTEVFLSGRES